MEQRPSLDARSSTVFIAVAEGSGYSEVLLPSLDFADVYSDKAGEEILNQMYTFEDKKGRRLALRPEGTATLQILANTDLKNKKDIKLWYACQCWRYEQPQAGRYREFTQFGIEILNPRGDYFDEVVDLAEKMVSQFTDNYVVNSSVKRGLAYYVDQGFEIEIPTLGAQKQVCGGGPYAEGIGFAIGVDRLMLDLGGLVCRSLR